MRDYLDEFTLFLVKNEKKSQNTVLNYRRDVNKYFEFLKKTGVSSPEDAVSATVLGYLLNLQKEGCAAATVTRSLSSIRCFYSYLGNGQSTYKDPTANLEAPRSVRKAPRTLTRKEVERLLEAPDYKTPKGIRDRAMLETLYATGIKVSELISLDISDVNTSMGFIMCGSTNKRILPIGRFAKEAIDDYIRYARGHFLPPVPEKALFLNCMGKRMSRQGLWKIIGTYKEIANISSDITPNILRHSFAAHLIENGADLAIIREMLGHADLSTTRIYSRLVKSQVKEVYKRTHPRA